METFNLWGHGVPASKQKFWKEDSKSPTELVWAKVLLDQLRTNCDFHEASTSRLQLLENNSFLNKEWGKGTISWRWTYQLTVVYRSNWQGGGGEVKSLITIILSLLKQSVTASPDLSPEILISNKRTRKALREMCSSLRVGRRDKPTRLSSAKAPLLISFRSWKRWAYWFQSNVLSNEVSP